MLALELSDAIDDRSGLIMAFVLKIAPDQPTFKTKAIIKPDRLTKQRDLCYKRET